MELLNGLSETSNEPGRYFSDLVALARSRPPVLSALEQIDEGTVARLKEADPAFAAEIDAYQERFGCRALSEDVRDPTLGEMPELTLGLVRDQLQQGFDPATRAAELERRVEIAEEACELLADRPGELARFNQVLERAQAVLELGRRLAQRGAIDEPSDAVFPEIDDA